MYYLLLKEISSDHRNLEGEGVTKRSMSRQGQGLRFYSEKCTFFTNRDGLMEPGTLTRFTVHFIATALFRCYKSLFPKTGSIQITSVLTLNCSKFTWAFIFSTQSHPMVRCQDCRIVLHDSTTWLKAIYIHLNCRDLMESEFLIFYQL